MLAGFERDLQRRLRPGSLRDGLWRQLKRLPIGDPALDVVEAAFAAQLVEGPDILKGMRERTMAYFWHDGSILARRQSACASRRDLRVNRHRYMTHSMALSASKPEPPPFGTVLNRREKISRERPIFSGRRRHQIPRTGRFR